jgi:hypothetical protein
MNCLVVSRASDFRYLALALPHIRAEQTLEKAFTPKLDANSAYKLGVLAYGELQASRLAMAVSKNESKSSR